MTVFVRPVQLDSDSQELLAILELNLPALPHSRRFRWLYYSNPDGPAWSWFACQKSTGRVIAVTSMFPRSMWVGGQLRMCGQVGDFAVSASHRSLGPALLMQRATFEPVDQGKLSFCYDCPPHEAGMATFRRLGLPANCAVQRYVLPLRMERQIRKRLGFDSRFLATFGNFLLRHVYRSQTPSLKGLDVCEHDGPFGEEFSQLDRAVKNADVIRGRRSAAHLNWRYREDPLQEYRVLTARRGGELIAFLVSSITSEHVTIVDLFGKEFPEAAIVLLEALAERCQSSYQTIEAVASEGSELMTPFLQKRFRRRSVVAQVVAYAKSGSEAAGFLQKSPRWAFNGADIRA